VKLDLHSVSPAPNKALQVTPVRWATFGLPGAAMSHVMSHHVSIGGAPELDRWAASTNQRYFIDTDVTLFGLAPVDRLTR
jgi:hypothetical protein